MTILQKLNHSPSPILLTGIPRSGTTLVCKLLNSLPDIVALHEPMDVMQFRGKTTGQIVHQINQFAYDNRKSILETRQAVSKHVNGSVPDNAIEGEIGGEIRKPHCSHGQIKIEKELTGDFSLAIKHNAAFTALLDQLESRFLCFGIIKNPFTVLISWMTVDMAVHYGRTPVGEALDPGLMERLDGICDQVDRQIELIKWFFDRFQIYLPFDQIIRYEDVISTRGKCLKSIIPSAIQLNEHLEFQAKYRLVSSEKIALVGERILNSISSFSKHYTSLEIKNEIDIALNVHRKPC